jgi:hypothetical protein
MKRYNYWCLEGCFKDNMIIDKEEYKKDDYELCPICGNTMKRMGEIPYLGGTFSSMSREQKAESLKKRSSEHFNTHVKEKKKWMDENYF